MYVVFVCFLDSSSLHELVNSHILQEKDPSSSICSLSAEENVISSEGGGPELVPDIASSPSPVCKPGKGVKAGKKAPPEAMKSWKKNGFSRFDYVTIYFAIISTYMWCDVTLCSSFSLIVAAPFVDAWSIVKEVFPLLSFSAPFVVYHQYLQVITIESSDDFNFSIFCHEIHWLCEQKKWFKWGGDEESLTI